MNRRDQVLASLDEKELDLVVIGGGLLGAGIALEAASAGLSVLIVDKDDFAAGSSSRSSKVAGAVAYSQSGQFGYGRPGKALSDPEALARLQRTAPHMVRDFTFLMPISGDRFLFSLQTQAYLALYDLRAGRLTKASGHKRLSRKETLRASQALAPEMVTGGLRFHDYFTDDSRFVIELIKAASARGALAINYMEARRVTAAEGKVTSITLRDRIDGRETVVKPRTVVSACGVWTEPNSGLSQTLESIESNLATGSELEPEPPLQLLRSTHIILPPSALETNGGALLLPMPNNRFVFVVPWQRALLVGTTAIAHDQGPENPLPTVIEIDYLLNAVNQYTRFDRKVTTAVIACAWAGLTIATSGSEPSVYRAANAVITAYGGHLANYDRVAREAVRLVLYQLNGKNSDGSAGKSERGEAAIMLGGFENKQDYLTTTAQISARARKLGLDPASLDHITTNYGKDALIILDRIEANPALHERICPDFPPLMAEIFYIVENEMAVSLEDVLCRRIRVGFLHREQCLDAAPRVAKLMQELCGWDSLRLKGELSALARNLASQLAPVLK
ncbi:MAG: FAD-dependent oxidoreductase [Cyanobacteria bacterium REEB67]|nr:FAD-dependent oxidoreductase [Cyanobacteria bacterium REEB67]